jgi:hypothetical protein
MSIPLFFALLLGGIATSAFLSWFFSRGEDSHH